MIATSPLNFLVPLLLLGLPIAALVLLYKVLKELRSLRSSVDELRHTLSRERTLQ